MSKDRVITKVPPMRRIGALKSNFKKYTEKRWANIDYIMDEKDVSHWYIRYRDFDGYVDEFVGAEVLAEMFAGPQYPFQPPEILFLTPQGVYNINTRSICTTISKYHSEDYPAVLGQGGFAREMLNGLLSHVDLKGGINIVATSDAEKRVFAAKSKEYNRKHHADLIKEFEAIPNNLLFKLVSLYKFPLNVDVWVKRYLNMEAELPVPKFTSKK